MSDSFANVEDIVRAYMLGIDGSKGIAAKDACKQIRERDQYKTWAVRAVSCQSEFFRQNQELKMRISKVEKDLEGIDRHLDPQIYMHLTTKFEAKIMILHEIRADILEAWEKKNIKTEKKNTRDQNQLKRDTGTPSTRHYQNMSVREDQFKTLMDIPEKTVRMSARVPAGHISQQDTPDHIFDGCVNDYRSVLANPTDLAGAQSAWGVDSAGLINDRIISNTIDDPLSVAVAMSHNTYLEQMKGNILGGGNGNITPVANDDPMTAALLAKNGVPVDGRTMKKYANAQGGVAREANVAVPRHFEPAPIPTGDLTDTAFEGAIQLTVDNNDTDYTDRRVESRQNLIVKLKNDTAGIESVSVGDGSIVVDRNVGNPSLNNITGVMLDMIDNHEKFIIICEILSTHEKLNPNIGSMVAKVISEMSKLDHNQLVEFEKDAYIVANKHFEWLKLIAAPLQYPNVNQRISPIMKGQTAILKAIRNSQIAPKYKIVDSYVTVTVSNPATDATATTTLNTTPTTFNLAGTADLSGVSVTTNPTTVKQQLTALETNLSLKYADIIAGLNETTKNDPQYMNNMMAMFNKIKELHTKIELLE
jgi:hypothetical protein